MAVADKPAARSFVKGAAILSAAGIASRVMGLVYRVVLIRMIGAEGMGIYQMAYPLYTIMLVVSRSGIPVTLAKMIADRMAREENREAYQVFTMARVMSVVIGALFTLAMVILAGPLINLLRLDPRAYYAILAISPAVFIVSIMATYRGFFQGMQDMKPTAASQIVEQLVRTITMIALAYFLLPLGLEFAAAGASFGAVTGALAGLALLLFIYFRQRKKIFSFFSAKSSEGSGGDESPGEDLKKGSIKTGSRKKILGEFARLGIPITFGALVRPLMNFVDWIFVPQRLQAAGFAMEEATTAYGLMTNVALPLINFPAILTVSLATSLVPAISEAHSLEDPGLVGERSFTALRLTVMLGIPAAVGMAVLAHPLSAVVFAEPDAASILLVMAWAAVFVTLQQTTSAILQGIGRTDIPARNLAAGAVVNAGLNFWLTGLPLFNIHGAAAATVAGFAAAAVLNFISVARRVKDLGGLGYSALRAAAGSAIMGALVVFIHRILLRGLGDVIPLAELAALLVAVAAGVVIYLALMIISGAVVKDDILMIPGVGEDLTALLTKWGILNDKL